MVDVCYPDGTDWSCYGTPDEVAALDPATKERSEALAWSTLSALTGYRLSLCPITVRPCVLRCTPPTYDAAPAAVGGVYSPFISGGRWYNACGCVTDCSCTQLCEVLLPGGGASITEVLLDGAVVDPSAYRVDNGNRLVRTDGGCWPACQSMADATTESGTFSVTYYAGVAPNDLFRYAAGVLAAEYYKACSGAKCRLPNGVTSITRTGITMEIPSGLFPNGATGIREVDTVIRIYNPNGVKVPPRILSPDGARGRVVTWSA